MAQRNYMNQPNKHSNNKHSNNKHSNNQHNYAQNNKHAKPHYTKYNSLSDESEQVQTNLYQNARTYFPKIELSYETRVHKKVQCDYAIAIPQGNKFYAWFTYYNNAHVCLMIQSGFTSIQPVLTSFNESLCFGEHGTLFYGTMVHYESTRFFSVEDVCYYKGNNVCRETHLHKMHLFAQMRRTNEIGSYAFNSSCITFGLPVASASLEDLGNIVPYRVFSIQMHVVRSKERYSIKWDEFVSLQSPNPATQPPHYASKTTNGYAPKPLNKSNKTFWVNADMQRDVYYLHEQKTGAKTSSQIAYIPNFETSRLLNSYFRNIKENDRLDALEESDDEEEFENSEADKYVFLDRVLRMECVYNARFKKWVPVKLAQENE